MTDIYERIDRAKSMLKQIFPEETVDLLSELIYAYLWMHIKEYAHDVEE
jgi:hypothetical protein